MIYTIENVEESLMIGNPDDLPSSSEKRGGKVNYAEFCQEQFIKLPVATQATAKSFDFKHGSKDEDKIVYQILADDEQITEDAMVHDPNYCPIKKDIPWVSNTREVDYNKVFFDEFFPSLKGKAERLDKYLSDERCSMYQTVKSDKIRFHRPEDDDPDHLVRH